MSLDDTITFIFIGLATTGIVAGITFPIVYWQARRDWRTWPFILMSWAKFFVSTLIVVSSTRFPVFARPEVRAYIAMGWFLIYIFYTIITLSGIYALIQSQRIKWARRVERLKREVEA